MDNQLFALCVFSCAVTSALTALLGDRVANGCTQARDCAQTPNDDNEAASGSQLLQMGRSTVVSQLQDMASSTSHVDKGSAISSATEPWSGSARGWLERFPKLEAAVNGRTHAQACVQIWTALGENSWMEFVDGRAHAGGPHVFDKAAQSSHPNRAVGDKSFQNQVLARDAFSVEQAWESRWSVEKLATLNARLRDTQCDQPSCTDMFDNYRSSMNIDASAKTAWLTRILAEYYGAIDAIPVAAPVFGDTGGSARISQVLLNIAVLFHKLALLHPFADGNSRTRLMVLQTELIRHGGHPIVLWDNYWGIYHMPNSPGFDADPKKLDNYDLSAVSKQLQEYVLDGWCGWEIAYNTAASPFSPFVDTGGTLAATPHSQYNAETGACEQGPGRSFWEVAFDPDHPDAGKNP